MKELGVNTIRVYHVDPSADHDGCMKAFGDAGIYILADLDTFDTYILPAIMDAFHQYANILGFFIGNENIAKKEDSPVAPYLKAAVRDMKAYRDQKGYRHFPIGYSSADILELRPMLEYYLTCGSNSSEIVDFFGLNSYSWCDPSTYEASSYNQLEKDAVNFRVPIFLTETGCNVPGPRKFDDQDAIFGDKMNRDWSGAIIYEWIQETNDYGLITYGPKSDADSPDVEDGYLRKGTPTPKNPDFDNLKSKWSGLNPTGVKKADYDPSKVTTPACPTSTKGGWWEVDGDVPLPSLQGGVPETTRLSGSGRSKPTTTVTSTEKVASTAVVPMTETLAAASTAAGSATTPATATSNPDHTGSGAQRDNEVNSASGSSGGGAALGVGLTAALATLIFML
ncbi:hypothetical protein ESCO_001740 [Escovopsis weberi]|uniref:1,3-beta-glucanosyltransferase n=1 Tax=Escovopsis weberi TaxID=150374 RepID=A0A0M9VX01_ESCWE|nr:hypothetical protein ESCO_001740 [Escovopsis weberi]